MAEATVIPPVRPRAALVFEVVRGAADGGLDLAVAVVSGGRVVLYQERRNGHPRVRYTTVCSWEEVHSHDVEHQLRAARERGCDLEAVFQMVKRKAQSP